jgi:L-iditol 2-dehydrogenase
MKAMVLEAPGDLHVRDVSHPQPADGEVVVRVTNSGICGTDLKIYHGEISVRHPLIMGHEMAGELIADGTDGTRSGDRVSIDPSLFCGVCSSCLAGQTNLCPNGLLLGRDTNGGFADFVVAPRSHVFPLPDSIDSQCAPLLQVVAVCRHAQQLVEIHPGQPVVVLGLGASGQMHIQLAKARGAFPVIGISRSKWKRELAERLGADLVFEPGDPAMKGVLEATQGRGAELIIESTGVISSIASAVSIACTGATLLLFGITTATEASWPFYELYFKELKIVHSRSAKNEDYPAAIDLVAKGSVKLKPLVSHVVSLSELGAAVNMLESDSDQRMKIVLENRW